VSHGEYADGTDRQTDKRTPNLTSHFLRNAASIKTGDSNKSKRKLAVTKVTLMYTAVLEQDQRQKVSDAVDRSGPPQYGV